MISLRKCTAMVKLLRPVIKFRNQYKRNLFLSLPEETPTLTTTAVTENFYSVVGTSKEYSPKVNNEERQRLMDLLPRSVDELPPRRMRDSLVSAIVPLKNDLALRDKYVTAFGTVRIGRLFEDLDIIAGACCYKHILNPRSEGFPNPYCCVTILVDSIKFSSNYIKTDEDIRLSAHISYVGKSSLEISVLIDQRDERGKWTKITDAVLVFVARTPLNDGPAIVNPLIADTPEEADYIRQGEERSRRRKLTSGEVLSLKPPNPEETELIHKLFLGFNENAARERNRTIPSDAKNMSDCQFNTLLLCHPEFRNRFNKIFGGFIMRQAFEIAFSSVYLYTKAKPKILFVDDILFRKPIEIGSLVKFSASVAYVEGRYIHVPVVAAVLKPETNEESITDVFHFTFESQGDSEPPKVLPHTYLEAMMYLDARRHFQEMVNCTSFKGK